MHFLSLQKNKLVGTILNIYNPNQLPLDNSVQGYVTSVNPVNRNHQIQANDFGHYMEYVDSPPDSKEAWPVDYLKSKLPI